MWLQRDYSDPLKAWSDLSDVAVRVEGDAVASADLEVAADGSWGALNISSLNAGPGTCVVTVSALMRDSETGAYDSRIEYTYNVEVLPSGFLMVGGTIVGAAPLFAGTAVFAFAVAIGFAIRFAHRRRRGLLCTYQTVASLAFCLFAGASGLMLVAELVLYAITEQDMGLSVFMQSIGLLASFFALAALPFVLLVCLFLVVSNVSLIRHEGRRPANMLGIATALLAAAFYLVLINIEVVVDYRTPFAHAINIAIPYLINLLGVVFLSTVICGLLAARTRPARDKDFVIILGCGIRKDGAPTPLLKGRIQRALDFAREQELATGNLPVLVCSGGQGPDEVTSEAVSMAGYLREQGVPEERILLEDKSTSTFENMKFSRALIDDEYRGNGCPRVAYSTTNYHVFRSGTFAHAVGLDAEGMGAKTKWYFWPNAFLREFVSLLVSSKVPLALAVLSIILFSATLGTLYAIIL